MSAASPIITYGKRWTANRKVEVVSAVRDGTLTKEQACKQHRISIEEFDAWERAFAAGCIDALHAKSIKQRRTAPC